MVKHFPYTPPVIAALERTMSRERLSTYLAATAGDAEKALCLYSWNVDISGALYAPLQGLEITLRNGLHDALSAVYSDSWYADDRIPLEAYATGDITKAENILPRRNTAITPPKSLG